MRFASLPGNATEIHEIEDQRCPGSLIAKLGLNVKDGTNQGRSLRMPLQESVPRPPSSMYAPLAHSPCSSKQHPVVALRVRIGLTVRATKVL